MHCALLALQLLHCRSLPEQHICDSTHCLSDLRLKVLLLALDVKVKATVVMGQVLGLRMGLAKPVRVGLFDGLEFVRKALKLVRGA